MHNEQSKNPYVEFASVDQQRVHDIFLQNYAVVFASCFEIEIEIPVDMLCQLLDVVEYSNTISSV